jgi:hypothetical protein
VSRPYEAFLFRILLIVASKAHVYPTRHWAGLCGSGAGSVPSGCSRSFEAEYLFVNFTNQAIGGTTFTVIENVMRGGAGEVISVARSSSKRAG